MERTSGQKRNRAAREVSGCGERTGKTPTSGKSDQEERKYKRHSLVHEGKKLLSRSGRSRKKTLWRIKKDTHVKREEKLWGGRERRGDNCQQGAQGERKDFYDEGLMYFELRGRQKGEAQAGRRNYLKGEGISLNKKRGSR